MSPAWSQRLHACPQPQPPPTSFWRTHPQPQAWPTHSPQTLPGGQSLLCSQLPSPNIPTTEFALQDPDLHPQGQMLLSGNPCPRVLSPTALPAQGLVAMEMAPVGTQPARAREAHLHLSAAAEPQRSWEPLLGPRMLTTHQKEKPHRALPPPHCPPNSVLPRESLLPAARPGCDPAAQGGSREAPGLHGAGQEGVAQSWSPAKAPGGTLRSHPARPLGPPATCKAVGQQYRLMPLPSEASPGQPSGKRPDPGQGQWPHSEAGRGGMDGRQGGRGVGRSASAETGAGSAPGVPTNSPETRAERLPLPAATQALCVPAAGGGGCPGRSGRPPALEAAAGSVAGRSH